MTTHTTIDCAAVTAQHGGAIARLLGGAYHERRREVALPYPMTADDIRAALGVLWRGVHCKRGRASVATGGEAVAA